jgi:type II secretory pathway component PulM
MLIATGGTLAQTPNQDPTIADLQRQIQEMRAQMAKMQNRIAELETTRGSTAATSSSDPALHESETPPTEALQLQPHKAKSHEEPTSFHFKGLTLTPGGFLE